ncbi:MAG TPA: hypothetical protein VGN88_05830 [Phycisphaerae bacterium]|jgi:hypothetical protein
MKKSCYPRAFMMMDLFVGLAMALALLMAMTMAVGRLQRTERELAEARATSRQLEQTAFALQTGSGEVDKSVQIDPMPASAGAATPSGMVWARLSYPQFPGRSLVALVPISKAQRGEKP